jgi:hypothetical protein
VLNIRAAQVDALFGARLDEYHRRLRAFFRQSVPDAVAHYDDAELLARIADAVRRARGQGVEAWDAMTRFVGLALLVEHSFDEQPAVQKFLAMPDLDPDLKVHLLADQFEQQLRSI